MKKFMIMVLAFFAIALVGCRGDDSKDDPHAEAKTACEQKAETHVWNEETNNCAPKSEPAKEEGELEVANYTVTLKADLSLSAGVNIIRLEAKSKNLVSTLFVEDKCIRLTESEFAILKISTNQGTDLVKALCDSTDAGSGAQSSPAPVADCEPGHYIVQFDAVEGGIALQKVAEPNEKIEDCERLASTEPNL